MNYQDEQIRALKQLADVAENFEQIELPKIPDWYDSPASLECIGDETRTPEELQAIGLRWQELAGKLHDTLTELPLPDIEARISNLHAYARDAQLALISLDGQSCSQSLDPTGL